MATFFTSDLHFGHANVIKYVPRPFKDVEEMDAELIRRWNAVVGPKDEVYVVGDFSLCKRARALEIATALNGVKYLISNGSIADAVIVFGHPRLAAEVPRQIEVARDVAPEISRGVLFEAPPRDWRAEVQRLRAISLHCDADLLRDEVLAEAVPL